MSLHVGGDSDEALCLDLSQGVSMGCKARVPESGLTMLNFVSRPSPCGGSWVGAALAEVLGTFLSLCTPLL